MKKYIFAVLLIIIVIVGVTLCSCSKHQDDSWEENEKYDLSVPVLNEDGWYLVFEDDFNGDSLNEGITFGEKYQGNKEIWTTSPHAIRWESNDEDKPEQACWWCPEMVEVKDSNLVVHSRYEENHTCSGDCPSKADSQAELKQELFPAIIIITRAQRILCFFLRLSGILNAV